MSGSESHPSAGLCASYISCLLLMTHQTAVIRTSRNSQCYSSRSSKTTKRSDVH